ncbi:hypothetical protein QTO34_003616 [Cnephaeus nilssonii]|uniref:Uncharacterized protein n=1 Tax=Cnephaeus nilssonii TaxID=3371016 RepID=A0AA40LJL7_CNENI|nr:hypothetical protein QTO34_003616 [Eptesicus nilssonii]
MDTLIGDMKGEELRLHEGVSSDGYLAHIFRHMAKELFNEDIGVLTCHTLRNKDFQECLLEQRPGPAGSRFNIQRTGRAPTDQCRLHDPDSAAGLLEFTLGHCVRFPSLNTALGRKDTATSAMGNQR